MRIRFPFAVAFVVILLIASSAGLLPQSVLPSAPEAAKSYIPPNTDKFLHFVTFFSLTGAFYFILDTSRKRVLHLTLIVCTLVLGVGSEVVQGLLPNDRDFDPWDVLANVLGSLAAVGLASAYHKRAAERKRRAKYTALGGEGVEDLELGDGGSRSHDEGQESGVVAVPPTRAVQDELDNWDENQPDDWDIDDEEHGGQAKMTPSTSTAGSEEPSKKD